MRVRAKTRVDATYGRSLHPYCSPKYRRPRGVRRKNHGSTGVCDQILLVALDFERVVLPSLSDSYSFDRASMFIHNENLPLRRRDGCVRI